MTIIDPTYLSPVQIPAPDQLGFAAYPDVVPFTQRDAVGYQDQLEGAVSYLRKLYAYLTQSNPQTVWDANVDALISAVNEALTAQTADNVQKMADEITAIAQSQITITDPAMLAVLDGAATATRVMLDSLYASKSFQTLLGKYYAPDPDGTDQTGVLLAAVNAAAATNGEVILGYGIYRANLDIANGFVQPIIRGRGRKYTTIRAVDTTKPVVKFNGGSGSIAGGGLKSLNIDGTDRNIPSTVGIAFSGCGGVVCEDVEINNCAVGVQWWNERTNDFTEFDTFEGSIYNTRSPFVYRDDNGVESFHGSGPVGNTIVGMPSDSDSPVISTVGNALPYNAPLSLTVFFSKNTQYLINYVNTVAGRHASFHGRVNIEGAGAAQLGQGSNKVLFAGTLTHFASGTTVLGNVYLCSKISYDGSTVVADLLPVTERYTLANTPTQRFAGVIGPGETAQVVVHLRGTNYDVSMVLLCYQSLYDGTGAVHVQDTMVNIDTGNVGLPTFSWNNGLYIANPNYSASFNAFAKLTVLGGASISNNVAQLA